MEGQEEVNFFYFYTFKFSLFSNLHATMAYLHAEKNELYESIERTQDNKILNKIKKIQEKI